MIKSKKFDIVTIPEATSIFQFRQLPPQSPLRHFDLQSRAILCSWCHVTSVSLTLAQLFSPSFVFHYGDILKSSGPYFIGSLNSGWWLSPRSASDYMVPAWISQKWCWVLPKGSHPETPDLHLSLIGDANSNDLVKVMSISPTYGCHFSFCNK